MTKEKM